MLIQFISILSKSKYGLSKNSIRLILNPCELGERFMGIEGIDDSFRNNIINNFQEGSTHVLNYKGITYLYWQDKFVNAIEEKEKEIRGLCRNPHPKAIGKNMLKKLSDLAKRSIRLN